MLCKEERMRIISLIQHEVVPAIGCTEPVAVALCAARAAERLGTLPERVEVELSMNVLKNAMGVGIPGTGMIGLPIAIALGMIVGKSSYKLEVLKEVNPEAVERGKQYIDEGRINIRLKEDAPDGLYIKVVAHAEGRTEKAVICGAHTRFIEEEGAQAVQTSKAGEDVANSEEELALNLRRIYDFIVEAPLEEIDFIEASGQMNMEAAENAFKARYGHQVGNMLKNEESQHMVGDSTLAHIMAYTCSACDARMSGAPIPVMSNSGSGNQGIAATVPVAVYARDHKVDRETYVRALALSNLTAIYIKQSLGRLSALCGCIVASTGASCGITYMMGGSYEQIGYAVKNMIANLTGMICDGAKPSCSLKLSSGVSTAMLSAMLAMQNRSVTNLEGIIDEDVDRSIRNLTSIGREAMEETNRMVVDIMTSK
ncbi:MAG: serine dehydratase subunit alpha family protein [Bacteroidaceae bacterium]|nr:serine dehydratase subunit alpha family protein [Bacteroidaceae bacterium]